LLAFVNDRLDMLHVIAALIHSASGAASRMALASET
jgi:hypothetical protein